MEYKVKINDKIEKNEVPALRSKIGWGPREYEYPILLERCQFYASVRGESGQLIAFGYICGMGLEHGYLEDIMVDPEYQRRGIGRELIKALLCEAKSRGILIVTATIDEKNREFYAKCGMNIGYSASVVY